MKNKLCLVLILTACGSSNPNLYQALEKKDVAADAIHALENHKEQEAIDLLEKELENDANNYPLISILSSAYAQRSGIDFVGLALEMTSTTETTNGIYALWPALPEASDANIDGVETAVDLLKSIPTAHRTDADLFKLALLSTVLVSLQMKALDTNGDGTLSVAELLDLSSGGASAVFAGLEGAISAIAGMSSQLGDNSDLAADQIEKVYEALNTAEGETQEEQISNYFSQSTSSP